MMRNTSFSLSATGVVALVLGGSTIGPSLPECTIDFEGTCPNVVPVCGASFSGGDGCLFEGLKFCYSSGFFAYKVTPAAALTITLSGNLTSLELFFSHQGAASGEMRFFDAVDGGNEVGPPLATNGDCLAAMPPMQLLSFPTPVRRIEVTASGGAFTAVWIDDFHVNPVLPSPADISGPAGPGFPDGCVDAFDLGTLLGAWCSSVGDPDPPGDVDPPCEDCTSPNFTLADISGAAMVPDGCVDAFDLAKLLANWCSVAGGNPCGTCFAPP